MLYHAMPIALIRISRSRSPANLPNPPAPICLSCHVHPSTHHVQPSPSNHPNASHLSLYSQIPHPLILIEIRKDIRTINKTKENPHRKPLQPRINLLNNILPRPSRPLTRQVCATVEGNLIFWISSGYEIVLTYKPPDMCQATWQWKAKMICQSNAGVV
jgi:hypothetical protein